MGGFLPAAGNIAKETIGSAIKESALPWMESFGSLLKRSNVGKIVEDIATKEYEPTMKRLQAEARPLLESIFSKVKPDLQRDVIKSVQTGVVHPNAEVRTAAQQLTKVVQARVHLHSFDNLRGETAVSQVLNWNKQVAQKASRVASFGPKDELITSAIVAAEKERGLHYAQSVADGFNIYFHESGIQGWRTRAAKEVQGLGLSSPFKSQGEFEQKLRSTMAWSFTSRIAIPHLSQVLNSVLINGIKNTAKAMFEYTTNKEAMKQMVLTSGAMEDEILYEMARDTTGKGLFQKIFGAAKQPGFHWVRRQEMMIHAIGGKYSAEEAAQKLIAGDKSQEVMLKYLGIDPANIIKQGGKLTDADTMTAMYRAAHEGMFIRSGMQTPYAWDTSMATRFVFMYKHFMFNQGRFIKDSVLRSYQQDGISGVLKTIGIIGTMYPVAGQAVKMLENIVTGHNIEASKNQTGKPSDNPVLQYLDAISYAAGFGIGTSIAHSARRRTLAEWGIGPVYGTVADLVQDFANIDKSGVKQIGKDIGRRVGGPVGPLLVNTLSPPKEKKSSGTY